MHHKSVMLHEVISSLQPRAGYVIVDATVGGAGHAQELIKRILPGGRLIGIDTDDTALDIARGSLNIYNGSFILVRENFRNIDTVVAQCGASQIDGAVFDLGVSSFQLDTADKGFSFRSDGPLDMRMDSRQRLTASEIVNRYPEKDLDEIIAQFGEERYHRRIAGAIVEARRKQPIRTTLELSEVVRRAVGGRYRHLKIDPATRTFQALRIVVNDELGVLKDGVVKAISLMRPGGRICVISFHSLEDRIIKHLFKDYQKAGSIKIVTKKPTVPSDEEMMTNPRARSAKMRVAERL